MRLSCGSFDSQTAQWQPSVGTPIEVPEPRTVSSSDCIGEWRQDHQRFFISSGFSAREGAQRKTEGGFQDDAQDYFFCAAFFAIASAATLDISIKVSLSWPRTSIKRSSSALERFPRVLSRNASSMSITSRAPSRSR